jgi:DNA-binding XRE family transcriptional regulator
VPGRQRDAAIGEGVSAEVGRRRDEGDPTRRSKSTAPSVEVDVRSEFSPSGFRKAREAAGLSREKLGRRIDRSYFSIESWELGKSAPSIRTACEAADALGVPVSEFFRCEEVSV